jgi:GNAT superfamily N-acetyltransferase
VGVQIRTASEADIPEMHRIRMSVAENRLSEPGRVQPDDYRVMLRDRGRGWVAEIDGRVVGFAVVDRSRANIWALFVDGAFERRGIGRALHDRMMDWLFATGAERAWLTTETGTRAERFYRAASWRHVGTENGEARYELSRQAYSK